MLCVAEATAYPKLKVPGLTLLAHHTSTFVWARSHLTLVAIVWSVCWLVTNLNNISFGEGSAVCLTLPLVAGMLAILNSPRQSWLEHSSWHGIGLADLKFVLLL